MARRAQVGHRGLLPGRAAVIATRADHVAGGVELLLDAARRHGGWSPREERGLGRWTRRGRGRRRRRRHRRRHGRQHRRRGRVLEPARAVAPPLGPPRLRPAAGGRCPTTTALRNKLQHHRQAIMRTTAAPSSTIWDELRQPPPRFALGSGAMQDSRPLATGRPVPHVSLVRRRAPRGPPELSLSSGIGGYEVLYLRYYTAVPWYRQTRAGIVSAGYRSTSWYRFLRAGSLGSTIAFCCSTDSVQPKH